MWRLVLAIVAATFIYEAAASFVVERTIGCTAAREWNTIAQAINR